MSATVGKVYAVDVKDLYREYWFATKAPTSKLSEPRTDASENVVAIYGCIQQLFESNCSRRGYRYWDRHTLSVGQIARKYKPKADHDDPKVHNSVKTVVRRYLRTLEDMGLLRTGIETSQAGAPRTRGRTMVGGQAKCLWIELVPTEEARASIQSRHSRRSSSVG